MPIFKYIGMICCLLFAGWEAVLGQACPPNIDFELGNFDGWRFYTGNVFNNGGVHQFSLAEAIGPLEGRHTLLSALGAGTDPYGGFPTNSPNGSAYSVKLGNDMGGGEGEAISYEFVIPTNRNTYSLVYYYAVVFQDPQHEIYEQPRMEIEINNLTDNSRIECASFSFIPFGSGLPGFFESPMQVSNTPILCKDWTPVTINLDGNAGKTIRLTFRTGDCTFRRHFGYAYIDVDTDCSGEFVGASFCPQDDKINVYAPFGFLNYSWYTSDLTREIGTGQVLTLSPPPSSGTRLNVKLTPYPGFGCEQTLATRLIDNLNTRANAGPDTISCNQGPVRIGSIPRPGLDYSWSPATGLSNAAVSNPLALPSVTTVYVFTVKSPGGGCYSTDTVKVIASNLGSSLRVLGRPEYCIGSGDSAVLQVDKALVINWFKNQRVINGETTTMYRVAETGMYYASMEDEYGCLAQTPPQSINISTIPSADFSIGNQVQCLAGNQFIFTNASSNAIGTMQYNWSYGGREFSSTREVKYSFTEAGNFMVKLVVRTNSACADSLEIPVTIFPGPVPLFDATAICRGMPFVFNNRTDENIGSPISYSWSIDGSPFSNQRLPPPQVFNDPGIYKVTLGVSSEQCPLPVQTLTKTLKVENPAAAVRYPIGFALRDVPLLVEARSIGVSARWNPAVQLSDPGIYHPVFKGITDREYTITLKTEGGCLTVDTLLVLVAPKADIQVPTAFTPNGDGLNDFLKPILIGINELRYFRIYNRWGVPVYHSTESKRGWDGNYKGNQQSTQSYVWMTEGISIIGEIIRKKGTVVLIR